VGVDVTAAQALAREQARHHLGGVWLVLLAASTFGIMPVLAQVAYDSGADIYSFLALRFGIAAAILWIWVLVRRHPIPQGKLLLQVIAIGAVVYVSQSLAFFASIQHADVSIVASIAYTYPILLMLLAAMTGRERIVRVKVAAALGAVAGAVLLVGGGGHAEPLGIVLVFAANAIYAGYLMVSEWIIPPGYATGAGVVIVTSAAAAYATIVAVGPHLHAPGSTEGWLALLGVTLGPTVIGVTALIAGLQRIKPVATATVGAAEPLVAVVLSIVLLGETVSAVQIAGLGLVVVSVVAVAHWAASVPPSVEPAAQR
jgi:drug/metabolite transporter (DMT)-like permease